MIDMMREWRDKFLGRGEAAITIPMLDGAFKPNRLLEDAKVLATLDAPEDLSTDGKVLFVADAGRVLRFEKAVAVEVIQVEETITALACMPGGGIAIALDGRQVKIFEGPYDGREWSMVNSKSLLSVNAISVAEDGRLLVTEGSTVHPYERWCHDLMDRGHTGRLIELDPATGNSRELKSGMHYAFGCCQFGKSVWVSETWKHRLLRSHFSTKDKNISPAQGKIAPSTLDEIVVDWLPGYPCRITRAPGGGFWLAAFAGRTQLVEFVLREDAYRKRMMAEVDPRHWIAPALSSGNDFLEPLQGAQVKMRGVLKPYAPPRSYGLVIRLDERGIPVDSFHSRLDGKNHGVVAAVECKGILYVLAKGNRRILQLPLSKMEGASANDL